MTENGLVLKQRNTQGVELQIKLINGRELQVLSKGKKAGQNYSVDILSLQDKSKKSISIAWKWLLSGVAFFLVMLLLLKVMPSFLSSNKNLYLGIIILAGVVGSLLCLIQFWKHTSFMQVFFSRNGHVPIVTLRAGKPSKKIFNDFITAVENRIEEFRNHMDVSEDKQLTGEIKMLRRLSDDGVISKSSYEKAKNKLLGGFDSAK